MTDDTKLTWVDDEALVVALRRTYPEVDPRAESYEQLAAYALKLPNFEGESDPGIGVLEHIRSQWWWGVQSV